VVDVERYFERIGYHGSREPVLATLACLQLKHTLALPFENLDPLLKRPVRLDLPSLAQKLLSQGRGGYCYEHNCLLQAVLTALGFSVTGLAARVLWNVPPGVVRARTHMLLKVDLPQGAYLVDAGFGGLTPTAPLKLSEGGRQHTPHEDFRVVAEDGLWRLEAWVQEAWKPLYRFDLQPQELADYEAANWYVSTHPASPFVSVLMATRITPHERHVLAGNHVRSHATGTVGTRRTLGSAADLRAELEGTFGIRLPEAPGLEELLTQQARGPAA
jgi:N-hydroxyarylamine O-acetyltransferase